MRVQRAIAVLGLSLSWACVHHRSLSERSGAAAAGINFVVSDSALGQPLQESQVRLVSERADTLARVTDASGEVRFDGLTPGKYQVLVRRIGYIAAEREITVAAGCRRRAIVRLRTHRCDLAPDCVDPRSSIEIRTCRPDA